MSRATPIAVGPSRATPVAVGPGLGGGNVTLVAASGLSLEVDIAADPDGGAGEWFSFRVYHLPVGGTFDVAIRNASSAPNAPDCWAEGFHVWASWDCDQWFPVANTRFEDGMLHWRHTVERSSCFYASFPPFTREHELRLLCSLRPEQPIVLTQTPIVVPGLEHPVDLLCFSSTRAVEGDVVLSENISRNHVRESTTNKTGLTVESPDKVGPTPPPRKRGASVSARAAPPRPIPRRPQSGPQQASSSLTTESNSTTLADSRENEALPVQHADPTSLEVPKHVPAPTASTPSDTRSPPFTEPSDSSSADTAIRSFQDTQVIAFRAHLFREEQSRSATAKAMAVLRKEKEADGRTRSKKVSKLEGQVAAHLAKATGLRHQIHAMCEDFWFGGTLAEMRVSTGRRVPIVIESCVRALRRTGLTEEGLFRVPGNAEMVDALRTSFERNEDPLCDCDTSELQRRVHDISSCLKLFLRELDDPVLTREAFLMWVAIGSDRFSERAAKVAKCRDVLSAMPETHVSVVRELLPLLASVAANADKNKMPAKNLAVVFGPTFLREGEGESMEQMLKDTPHSNSLAEFLISNCHDILGTAEPDDTSSRVGDPPGVIAVTDSDAPPHAVASTSGVTNATDAVHVVPRLIPKTWTERQFLDYGVTRSEAEALLDEIGVDGTFVIRASYFPDITGRPRCDSTVGYSVSCHHAGRTHHSRVLIFEGNMTLGNDGFSNLAQLVRHYQGVPLPCGQRLRYPVTRLSAVDFKRHAPVGFTSEQIVAAISNARGRPLTAVFQDTPLDSSVAVSTDTSDLHVERPVAVTLPTTPRMSVCIISRQQPLATAASWCVEGLLTRFADSGDPASIDLLGRCGLAVVPNACLGGSDRGLSRTNCAGVEVRSSWALPDCTDVPEVEACREAIQAAQPDLIIEIAAGAGSARVELVVVERVEHADGGSTRADSKPPERFCTGLERANPDCCRVAANDVSPAVIGEGSLPAWAAAHLACPTVVLLLPSRLQPPATWSPARCKAVGRAFIDALRYMVTEASLDGTTK